MIRFKFTTQDYLCDKLGEIVIITQRIAVHHNEKTGEIILSVLAGMYCSHSSECDVEFYMKNLKTFDWSRCIHPLLKK